jgi:hypothetical protein
LKVSEDQRGRVATSLLYEKIEMSQRINTNTNLKKRRRMITLSWVLGLGILTFVLIWKEQTALLYILATLGVTALLTIVAVSDIGVRKEEG